MPRTWSRLAGKPVDGALLARAFGVSLIAVVVASAISGAAQGQRRRATQPAPAAAAAHPGNSTPSATGATNVAPGAQPAATAVAAPASAGPVPRPFGTAGTKPVGPPDDIAGAKAYAVLEASCATCHQARAGEPSSAAGGFGNVLDIAALAREPTLVRPGLPDGSRLYQTLLTRHAPLDVYKATPDRQPTIADVEIVRGWIEQLKPSPLCTDRQPLTPDDLARLMRQWLEQIGPEAAKSTRFVSLAHIYNACASEAELAAYRQGAEKLLNSLSWAPTLARIETVGDGTALLAFKLADLGWVPAHWDRLAMSEPQGGAVKAPQAVKDMTGSDVPVLRADWLAYAAARSPLYYELLGLPERQTDLLHLLGFDGSEALRGQRLRAGIRASGETSGPRILERRTGRDGHFAWLSYDWPATTPAAEVFDQPLEPQPAGVPRAAGKEAPKHEATRLVLGLPNGMLLFAAHDRDGRRLDQAGGIVAGQPCMACHATGIVAATDEMRAHLQSDRAAISHETRDTALALYPGQGELQHAFEEDAYRYRRALVQSGIDPDLTLAGLEPVTALARRYERDVDLSRLAAEAGLEADALRMRLQALQGEARALGQRLLQGLLRRAEAERLLVALADPQGRLPPSPAADADAGKSPALVPATVAGLGVSLWSDRPSYRVGDLVTFNVQASEDCYLTLIDIDAAGKATVLFPNDFEQENLISAGSTVRIPSEKSPYQLRFKEKGQETAVAVCSLNQKLPAGIALDYERQRFPSLGLWRNFLSLSQTEAIEAARNGGHPKPQPRPARGRTAEAKPEPAPTKPDMQGRTAIAVTVE